MSFLCSKKMNALKAKYHTMELPMELYHMIAAQSESTYRALLALPPFARSIDVSARYDYMIMFGYSVTMGPPLVVWARHGLAHKVGGPAVEHENGNKWWYQNGLLHREDGPAVVYTNGYTATYLKGIWLGCTGTPV